MTDVDTPEQILNWLSPGSASHRKYQALQRLDSWYKEQLRRLLADGSFDTDLAAVKYHIEQLIAGDRS